MKKSIPAILLLCSFIIIAWKNTTLGENFHQWQFDIISGQSLITSQQDIDNILNSFESVAYSDLPNELLSHTNYDSPKYKKLVRSANFLKIKGKDIFKFIVGDFRIKHLLPRDDAYYNNINALGEGKFIYWLVDKKLLYKLLELQNVLVENGYNETGFEIVNGYRHPAYNAEVGGASMSRHLQGQALDISIKDINDDGRVTQTDKKIVLDLLEKKVIKNKGGIGRYPGTMSIHFDVRGFRARWNKH